MSKKRLRAFVPALAAGVVLGAMVLTQNLPDTAQTFALAGLVASAIVAAVVQRDDLRTHLTVILAIFSATAAGFVRIGPIYLLLAIGFAVAVTIALRPPDADAPPARGPRATRARLVLAVVGGAVAAGLFFGLPPLHKKAEHSITRWLSAGIADSSNVGFASRMRVGSMHHMLFDDRVVFRVYGKRPQYLRGAVLDRYERGEWWSSLDIPRTTITATTPLEEAATRIDVARDAPLSWGIEARWFTSVDACELHTTSGVVSVDPAGIYHPEPPDLRDVIAYSSCATPHAPAAPREEDTSLPPRLRAKLAQIATPWTAAAKTDGEKLAAIERALGRFEYSLHVDWDLHKDPVIDFLESKHAGHCELFASSMALLARASGVPARVVTGYRVSEENELGGYAIVRQNNGHAWVEAWVDGAWRTYDPTPLSEDFAARHGRFDHAIDAAGAFADRVGRKTLAAGAAFVFAVLWAIKRWIFPLVGRLFARRRARDTSGLPLPCLVALESALAARGHARDRSEPLERFARRLEDTSEPWTSAVATALRAYAALRYGGVGEENEVVRAVERAASAIGR